MNNLQKLLRIRGIGIPRMADEIGRGYHSVQKVIKGTRTWEHIRQDIADYLGLKYYQVWGETADNFILKLIEKEIERQAGEKRERLRYEYLEGGISDKRNHRKSARF